MERGENQVAGFSGGHGDAHGFRVAHFAYNDHVGSLAQRGAQSGGKIRRIRSDFHLLNDAANVRVLVFDGIFDHHDMARFPEIDFVDQRSERGGLSRTGRAADQDQAAR